MQKESGFDYEEKERSGLPARYLSKTGPPDDEEKSNLGLRSRALNRIKARPHPPNLAASSSSSFSVLVLYISSNLFQ
jgi:hypothetical protein